VTNPVLGQVIQLNLRAQGSDWIGLFDHLEVWRSVLGADGPYTEMTAASWLPPTFPPDLYGQVPPSPAVVGPQVPIEGLVLNLLLDEETPITITFTGLTSLTFSQAATQITAQGEGLLVAFVWMDGRLVLTSMEPGNKAILHILGGNAAPLLGLPTTSSSTVAYGKDARLELIRGQELYQFIDYHGDPDFWYKTRFRQALTGNVSDFSLPFAASSASIVDTSTLIIGTVDLIDAQGKPVQNREVSLYTRFGGAVAGTDGVIPRDIRQLTDENGHAEFSLVRGLQVTVAVAGTQLVRDITVPTDMSLSSFGLLDPGVGSNDVFVVQVPNVDYVVRRSL
jgi:hypothetical protein